MHVKIRMHRESSYEGEIPVTSSRSGLKQKNGQFTTSYACEPITRYHVDQLAKPTPPSTCGCSFWEPRLKLPQVQAGAELDRGQRSHGAVASTQGHRRPDAARQGLEAVDE